MWGTTSMTVSLTVTADCQITTPTINSVTWAATGAGNTSSLLGIQEAYYDKQLSAFTATTTGFVIELALRSRHESGSDHVDGHEPGHAPGYRSAAQAPAGKSGGQA